MSPTLVKTFLMVVAGSVASHYAIKYLDKAKS